MTHPYTGISLGLKRKGILTRATAWMNLEDIMLSGINQTSMDKYCRILLPGSTYRGQGHESRTVLSRS